MSDYFYALSMLIPSWYQSPVDRSRSLQQELADEDNQ